jgi:hypothetical protein
MCRYLADYTLQNIKQEEQLKMLETSVHICKRVGSKQKRYLA